MRHPKTAIALVMFLAIAFSQKTLAYTLDSLFAQVEQDNPTLLKYAAQCKTAKLEAKTGINLPDPEVEFAYLWGDPGEIGTRYDLSVSQSFNCATLFGMRRREARSRAELADIEYEQARNLVFYAVEQLVVELTYTNRCVEALQQRVSTAAQLEEAYKRMLQQGEVNKIEMSRVQLNKVTAEAALRTKQIEREALITRIKAFMPGKSQQQSGSQNGSADMNPFLAAIASTTEYPSPYINGDRSMAITNSGIAVAEKHVKTAAAEGLPEFSAGYMSENTAAEKFRGIKVGVSIPLWSNRNNVARAKASRMMAVAARDEMENSLKAQRAELAQKEEQLQKLASYLQTSFNQLNTTPLMLKALNAGELSLVDFLNDRVTYYDVQDQMLTTERDHQLTLAEWSFVR